MGGSYRVELDPRTLSALLVELKAVEPKLATGMRREVRRAGDLVKQVAQAEIRSYTDTAKQARAATRARHYIRTSMREELAASIVTRISTRVGRRQGVTIVSTGKLLPAKQQALVKAMNRKDFTHKVFGRGDVPQTGARYFRPATLAAARELMLARIRVVMEEALAALVK
ncbi:MAG: hypothetical protein HIU88_10250 [Acidobacteria bacterium]|nr:hypothetical protein [Acidobacteriota bacterium]